MFDFDPLVWFTRAIFLAVTVYYVLWLVVAWRETARLLAGTDPRRRLLRLYVSYCLVTINFQPLRSELVQVGLWTLALILVLWADLSI